jgi:hypothetical protein
VPGVLEGLQGHSKLVRADLFRGGAKEKNFQRSSARPETEFLRINGLRANPPYRSRIRNTFDKPLFALMAIYGSYAGLIKWINFTIN